MKNSETARPQKYDLSSLSFFSAPEPTLEAMRRHDPVYWHEPLQSWVLTRYEDVQHVIRDKNFSVDRGGSIGRGGSQRVKSKLDWCNEFLLQWMVFSDPPRHTRLRALVVKAFSPQAIEKLREPIEAILQELIDAARAKGRMEVVADLAVPFPALVTGHMLALPREKTKDLKRWADGLFRLVGAGIAPDDVIESTYEGLFECKSYFASLVDERRKHPGDDMISRLIAARDQEEALTEDELVGVCATLMAGAYETTTHLIVNGLFALLKHPAQLNLLRSQPALIDSTIEELFRYNGPALSLMRRPLQDVVIRGQRISAGENICCMLHAANHDPDHFEDPKRLDITRANNRHLSLGLGMHFCLGAALTRLEARAAISSMVQQFPDLSLDQQEPDWLPNLVMRGLQSLNVRLTPARRAQPSELRPQ